MLQAQAHAVAPIVAAASSVLIDTLVRTRRSPPQNADERRDPASLTKLMTAYLTFAALRDEDDHAVADGARCRERAWHAEGSRMFIEPRKAVSVDELLHGMIVQSGNDASIALAELVAGTEEAFVERMNREAARLGLRTRTSSNATGLLDPQHYSTAPTWRGSPRR